MKAIVYKKFGGPEVLHSAELPKPVPGKKQVLVKVNAASVNAYDWRHLKADPFMIRFMGAGLFTPKHRVLGADISGVVEITGSDAIKFAPGDEVFGEAGYGGFAEYVCVNEDRIVPKPRNISFEEAAAAPMAALTALQGIRDHGNVKEGQSVLINGASGGVGSYAVQIAKWFGARVTAVCSGEKKDMVSTLDPEEIIDYRKQDVTLMNRKFDLIFDSAGYRPVSDYKRIMKPGARYIMAGGSTGRILKLMITPGKKMRAMVAQVNTQDLHLIANMLESGKVRSIIDQVYPLEETALALSHLMERRVKGKVVVKV